MTNSEATETRRSIVEETKRDPWASQQEIADRVGVSRPWVTEVVQENPDLRTARTVARHGVEFDGTGPMLGLIETLAEEGQIPEAAAELLAEALERGDLAAINVQFIGGKDD